MDPQNPKPGDLLIDATPLKGALVDLPDGGTKGLSREKEGCEVVMDEINTNHAEYGVRAGITDNDLVSLNEYHQKIEAIDRYLPAAEKLVELLRESRAIYEDKRERQIKLIVSSVESRSAQSKDVELLGRYGRTREYYSRHGKKSAQTRLKNSKEESETKE